MRRLRSISMWLGAVVMIGCGPDKPAEQPSAPPAAQPDAAVDPHAVAAPTVATPATAEAIVDAGAPAAIVTQKCVAGVYGPKGCVADKPYPLPALHVGEDATVLQKKFEADQNKADAASLRGAVEIAVALGRRGPAKSAQGRLWYGRAKTAYDKLARVAAPGSSEVPQTIVDAGAEAAFAVASHDAEDKIASERAQTCPGKTMVELFGSKGEGGAYKKLVESAKPYTDALEAVAHDSRSPYFSPAALARSGVIYAHIYDSLAACTKDNVQLLTPQQAEIVKKMKSSGRDDLAAKADDVTEQVAQGFEAKRARELTGVGTVALREIVLGITLGNAYAVPADAFVDARKELATLRGSFGEDKSKGALASENDPTDPDRKRMLDVRLTEGL